MDSHKRFEETMKHCPVDRPPIDIGGMSLTSMSRKCQESLRQALGFTGEPIPTNTGVDERILQWAGTDFRSVGGLIELPSPHSCIIDERNNVNCWGIPNRLVGSYWEIVNPPLRGATVEDLDRYVWPEPRVPESLLAKWEADAKRLHEEGKYVVVAEHPVFGILELACWMCGYDDFLLKIMADPDFVKKYFDKVLEIQLKVVEQYYSVLGPYITLTTSGDDFGMQSRPLVSPEMFEDVIAPYFSARIARTKEIGKCYYWHHSCGSIFELLDKIIACGVDILNPIQTSAEGMVPAELKRHFGDRLVFWGGVDVQSFLRLATPEMVREGVKSLIEELGRDGGYVIAPAHNMQDDIPPENIIAWVEAMR
jgi:uroporphyrinogen decarboxylase